ncbi:hypothetical protein MLD52_00995 [Puniceicoccaceae bacterium K14]|nr:hypothetical protein [Puniceicoccaceae bacterium K14]
MKKLILTPLFVLVSVLCPLFAFGETASIYHTPDVPRVEFALNDLLQTLKGHGFDCNVSIMETMTDEVKGVRFVIGLRQDEALGERMKLAGVELVHREVPEAYSIRISRDGDTTTFWGIGADATGAMYAGLDLAETISHDGVSAIVEKDCAPHVGKRGLKMNIPLDARTPAYADAGDAAQNNIAVVWDIDFWKEHLDALARDRYNTITLWGAHPFPSLVKVPEYPDVALEDVKIADVDWPVWFAKYAGGEGAKGMTKEFLASLKVVKKMTIEEKIEFWREVMQYADDRGIEFHIITWNIFVWGADGKYGITGSIDNETTIDYMRCTVRSLFETYPLLAGIGVTAGENMKKISPERKENWLWDTYGKGVMDIRNAYPDRKIRFIHRYWMSKIPEITKHFDGFDDGVDFNFSYKYAKARLYSHTNPSFVDSILRDAPEGTKWWWNLRNDDIFYFRWGDPDYVREFINNFPSPEQTEGFHMGSDGYVWGREFVSTEPDPIRELEVEKHWYKFMLWGRLGYDPKLSNTFFEKAMQQRFPGKPTKKLQEVWSRASKIIPAVNREHWHDWDYQWAVEACSGRKYYHAITEECWKPGGGAAADEIQGYADFVLKELVELRKIEGDKTWRRTLGDMEAMSHLGNYYAEKIRAADFKESDLKKAIECLKKALKHWERYAEIGQKQYKSQLLSRAGHADWQRGYENAKKDIMLLEAK